jgi:hypothetical protein
VRIKSSNNREDRLPGDVMICMVKIEFLKEWIITEWLTS